jgi:diacylglycerol O-acyltransferase
MPERDGEFMRASDAFSWYQETDPAMRATIVGVAWLDGRPDWETLQNRLEAASRLVPRFRQRVEEPPARLAPPRWVIDENFDLSWHLRRVDAPAPHTPAEVLELARVEAMTGFDRARPLWVCTLVEHLGRDRAALILKVHHSLTDGQGAIKLAPLLFDATPSPVRRVLPPAPEPERGALMLSSLAYDVRRFAGLTAGAVKSTVPAGRRLLGDPLGVLRDIADTTRSIGQTVAPVFETLSPVMRARGPGRVFELVTVDLADLKAAARAANASVNDAFLAGVTGGLRRYHRQYGSRPGQLRVTMPISIRTESDPVASNRITLMRFPLPVAEPDPAARMARIRRSSRQARNQRSLGFTDAIAGGLNLLPTTVVAGLLKRVDFLASDVAGLPRAAWIAGAKVTAYCAFGPTMGCSANLTLLSYAGACHIGVNLDSSAVPDAGDFAECLREGFGEVVALAPSPARHDRVRLPIRDGTYPGSAPGSAKKPSTTKSTAPTVSAMSAKLPTNHPL